MSKEEIKANELIEAKQIIQILSLRKRQFVKCKRSVLVHLINELEEKHPKAKIVYFGLDGGCFSVIRAKNSTAKDFKLN